MHACCAAFEPWTCQVLGQRQRAVQRRHHMLSQDSRLTLSIPPLPHNPLHHRSRSSALPPTACGSLEDHKPSSLSSPAPWKGTFNMSECLSQDFGALSQNLPTCPHSLSLPYHSAIAPLQRAPIKLLEPVWRWGYLRTFNPPVIGSWSQQFWSSSLELLARMKEQALG